MTTKKPILIEQDDFARALAEFEQSLETPFVPGELEQWIAAVRDGYEEIVPLLAQRQQSLHEGEYQEIADADPGLLQRVEEMREEDSRIQEDLDAIDGQIATFERRIPQVEPDEARLTDDLSLFADSLLSIVLRIRKQDVAARTWLGEAFGRDEGDGD